MSHLRTILLIGCNSHLLRTALQTAGFNGERGFQLVEVSGSDAAKAEFGRDDSIVAVATAETGLHDFVRALVGGRMDVAYALVNENGVKHVPHMFWRDLPVPPRD